MSTTQDELVFLARSERRHQAEIYSPLNMTSDEIRLIRPIGSGIFELETFRITCAPVYSSLSYCWGDDSPEVGQSIILRDQVYGSHVVQVTSNLKAFLDKYQALSVSNTGDSSSNYLWADALCIDQANWKEKNHQVRMMARIFSQAHQVIVWLGDYSYTAGDTRLWSRNWLADFVRSAYWTRMWIVQEFVLAKSLIFWMGMCQFTYKNLRQKNFYLPLHKHIFGLWCLRDEVIAGKQSDQSLEKLIMTLTRGRKCHDRRDLIFSLIGLCDEPELEADYNMSSQILCNKVILLKSNTDSIALFKYLHHLFDLEWELQQPLEPESFSELLYDKIPLLQMSVPTLGPEWNHLSDRTKFRESICKYISQSPKSPSPPTADFRCKIMPHFGDLQAPVIIENSNHNLCLWQSTPPLALDAQCVMFQLEHTAFTLICWPISDSASALQSYECIGCGMRSNIRPENYLSTHVQTENSARKDCELHVTTDSVYVEFLVEADRAFNGTRVFRSGESYTACLDTQAMRLATEFPEWPTLDEVELKCQKIRAHRTSGIARAASDLYLYFLEQCLASAPDLGGDGGDCSTNTKRIQADESRRMAEAARNLWVHLLVGPKNFRPSHDKAHRGYRENGKDVQHLQAYFENGAEDLQRHRSARLRDNGAF